MLAVGVVHAVNDGGQAELESGFCLVSDAIGKNSGKGYIQVIIGQPKGSGLTEDLSVRDVKFVYNTYAN